MGYLSAIWQADYDPTDASNPTGAYTAYTFVPAGAAGPVNMSMGRDFSRRESVTVIPSLDSVLDGFGRNPGPMDRRDMTFSFRRFTNGDNDAEYDRLMAWLAPGGPWRLVYQTDSGAIWYTIAYSARLGNTETAGGNWGHGGYQDFAITFRIRPDWRPRFSEAAEVFHASSTFASSTTFGSLGVTVITTDPQAFFVDATGTAGVNLPTLPDTAPTITLNGPLGGTGGLLLKNNSVMVRDTTGALQPLTVTIPFQLVNSSYGVTLRLDRQSFTINGTAFRPTKPNYQKGYFSIRPGVINSCAIVALGGGVLTGGSVKVDWWRKRA